MRSTHPSGATRRRPTLRTVAALLACGMLSACGGALADGPGGSGDAGAGGGLVAATPLADPGTHVGPSTARLPLAKPDPVAQRPTPALPVTVTDAQGTKVTVKDASRILAIDVYGTLSRTVFELGLGERVVGRDISSTFPGISQLPLVTSSGHDLSAEAILELAPSVIITDTSLGPWDVVLQMRDAGIPVVVVDSKRSLESIGALVTQVAQALGVPAEGAKLAQRTAAEVAAARAAIAKVAPKDPARKLRMAFLYVRGQAGVYYLFGEGSGADSLVGALGGRDVAAEIGWKGMRPVNDEGLVKAAPDVILMMSQGLKSVGGVDGLIERMPAVANTPAGKHRRIVDMDDAQVMSFGPDAARVLDALAVAVYAPGSSR